MARRGVLHIVAAYAVFAALWILVSDKVLLALVPAGPLLARLEIGKGWAFVAVTALLLYVMLRRLAERLDDTYASLAASKSQADASLHALAEGEQRLRLALQAARQGLFDLDIATGQVTVSGEYAQMLGYDPETFRETFASWRDRLHPDDRQRAIHVFEVFVSGELPDYRNEFRMRKADGAYEWILSIGRIVERDERGAPVRMIGTHADIAEAKAAEHEVWRLNAELEQRVAERTAELTKANSQLLELNERLEKATRAKSDYLASMSHEFRTPLNSIIGFTGIMLSGMAGPITDEERVQLGMVEKAGKRLLNLVNGLLDLAKIEAGMIQLRLEDVDVGECVEAILDELRPLATERGIELRSENLSAPTLARTDRLRFEQILVNLVGNSVKFTESGSVTASIRIDNGWISVAITDTGIGIAQEDLARVFGAFQQVERSETTSGPIGTGLGLVLSMALAEVLGGRIEAVSTLGSGSTFTLTLPIGGPAAS